MATACSPPPSIACTPTARRVIVSVDCGIRAPEAARRARELGVDLIITDHHEPDTELPKAVAVVNPKRRDCRYPDKHLAGVGVALKVVQGLCQKAGKDGWLHAFVKIAAIGTLADVVPLVGENRVIAKLGLEQLTRGPHKVGLRALLDVSGLAGKTIDAYHIAFMVAPRVNAAGRMASADIATRLLLASDDALADEAQALAQQLDAENTKRRSEEQDIVARRRRRSRPIPTSAPTRCSWSAARAGTAASSASSPRSSSTPTTGRRSCCRWNTAWRTARAAAFPASTSWPRSNRARRCCSASAATSRRPACSSTRRAFPSSGAP